MIRESQRRWVAENKEKVREGQRQWYLKNKEKAQAQSAAWAKAHPESKRASCRKYQAKNKEILKVKRKAQYDKDAQRKQWNKWRYGITLEQFESLLNLQGHKCASCRDKFGNTRVTGPYVDHCHETGVVRGLLCRKCNHAEGILRTPDRARRLYEYMLKNELFYQGRN